MFSAYIVSNINVFDVGGGRRLPPSLHIVSIGNCVRYSRRRISINFV